MGRYPCTDSMSGCIELMQTYLTTNRSGDWLDFLANSTGVLLAVVFGYYVIRPFLWTLSS